MLDAPMSTQEAPSALAVAALAMLGDGATPSGLAERFAALDADASRGGLEELARLGLALSVHDPGGEDRYTLTPLGERLLRASFAGDPEHADMLAEVEQMRTELLSTIAHELRTPLTAVRTSVGLLLDPGVEPSPEERRTLLRTIDRNATRMQRVVGDILDLSRFRAGRIQLQLRRFDARELAGAAITSVAPLADARRQAIELEAPADPAYVFGDFRRLEQALVNLLSNANTHAPEGGRIDVAVRSTGAEVSWSVADEGQGIAPEDQARLFERFFVAGRDRRQAADGIGLGLPIARLIVEAHGGRIEVDSRVGHGSRFTIVVPAQGPEQGSSE
jgi:signal transduction histidine kinase